MTTKYLGALNLVEFGQLLEDPDFGKFQNLSQFSPSPEIYIKPEKYLEIPQILIKKEREGFLAIYNYETTEKILEMLDDFRAGHGFRHPLDNLFYGYIQRKSWKKGKTQKRLVNFLAKAQAEYLQTEDPLGMVGITHEYVARALACQRTKIERFSHNLSIQLPSGRVTFANELIPGAKILKYKSLYALKKQLSENPRFRYLSDEERAEILQDEFHIPVKRRVVNNYMHMIEGSSEAFI